MSKKESKKTSKTSKNQLIYSILTGVFAGLANGIVGGGGGMIVVPMLNHLLNYQNKYAHATAILIILPLSIVSGLFYLSFGNFNINVGVPVCIGVVIGGLVGAILLSKISSKIVGIIFSVLMAVAGIKMLLF